MRIVVADSECFYSDDYTLSKMSTEAFVRDPRFEDWGWAVKWQHNIDARWYTAKEWEWVAKNEDWSDVWLICHHAQYDGFILSQRYDVHPRMLGCTLSMARLILGNHLSVSLDSVRKHFGMPAKITPYGSRKGKHWNELSPAEQQAIADGCCDETESIWQLFQHLAKEFPPEEYEVVDTTMKMFTEPTLRGDIDLLAKVWEQEETTKQARYQKLAEHFGYSPEELKSALQSADMFAALLRSQGIEPDMKDGKHKQIYAFAKNDQFMRDLQDDEDDTVRALAEARLGAKSTQLQTRAATFGFMATRGAMPVYLRYAGAHTTRFSGGDGANWQNLKRTDPDNPKRASPIRRAIMAPEGYVLGIADLSQIECRILNYLAGQWDVVERFKNGEDPYTPIASQFYGRPITRNDKEERGTGKQMELSCGYMCGPPKFQATAKLGIYGPPVYLSIEEAERGVKLYRDTHPMVTAYWKTAGRLIARIAGGTPLEWGPMRIENKRIYGPGGTFLKYETLEYYRPVTDEELAELPPFKREGYWRHRTREGWTYLYSGKLVENVVQWLARVVMTQAMVRIARRGYKILTSTHDELVVLLKKDQDAEKHHAVLVDEMRMTPTWLPGIPLDAEGGVSDRYEK